MENVMTKGFVELSTEEKQNANGGFVWWEYCVAAWVLYEVGYALGKTIYHATH